MQLFYNKELTTSSKQIQFNKEESRHIVRVLRKKTGDVLHITNGKGLRFTAEISLANEKNCTASILDCKKTEKPWNYTLHVAIAPTKSMDRFEWFLEKATEIGIDKITPLFTDNSERRVVKLDRIEKIVVAAAKQSLKDYFPELGAPQNFSEFISTEIAKNKCIAHCFEAIERIPLKDSNPSEDVLILIGPEGDFSKNEVQLALNNNFTSISLGESRLRTETAGIVAVHTVSLLNQ